MREVDRALNSRLEHGRGNVLALKAFIGAFCAPSLGTGVRHMVKPDFHGPWEGDGSHDAGSLGHGGPTPRITWVCVVHDLLHFDKEGIRTCSQPRANGALDGPEMDAQRDI